MPKSVELTWYTLDEQYPPFDTQIMVTYQREGHTVLAMNVYYERAKSPEKKEQEIGKYGYIIREIDYTDHFIHDCGDQDFHIPTETIRAWAFYPKPYTED